MQEKHDPYLQTAARSINEKIIKDRKKKFQESKEKNKSYFKKEINLTDYFNLPEPIQYLVFFLLFIFIPFIVGFIVLSFMVGMSPLESFTGLTLEAYLFTWILGYETLAVILLLNIFENAFFYSKTSR
jgi:uncharacterized membrane protein